MEQKNRRQSDDRRPKRYACSFTSKPLSRPLSDLVALTVGELSASQHNDVDQPPNAQSGKRNDHENPSANLSDHETVYPEAVRKACDLAGIDRWTPHRLRHTAATRIRERFGLEATQVFLGHANIAATQIYAEADRELAYNIAEEIG